MNSYLQATKQWVKEELKRCVDFWVNNGFDRRHGGMYTCLDRKGQVFSTDKSVWMQGRAAWTFSRLCNQYGERAEWREVAESCLDFMEKHCVNHEAGNRMYFTVTEDGKPLRQRRYNFSEGFYAMANAEYYILTQNPENLKRARSAYDLIWDLNRGIIDDPTGLGPKTIPETRQLRGLGGPMIYLNLTAVMRKADPEREELYNKRSKQCVHDIFAYHRKKDMKCTLENVGLNGEFLSDVTEGRIVNPGHDIECAWFLMDEANRTGDKKLYKESEGIFLDAINAGWDNEYGGLLYFIDCLGKPPEAYEHDMKLWWPHNEILIAAIMAYRDTKDQVYLDWFKKTLDYCQQVFSDPEYGEWYGYLRRDGKPTQPPCKGSTFKGPFHLPRMLMAVDEVIDQIKAQG
ncbi:MAG TPA: N-acylglucosamine 2-epimerase [Clostridiales bacterium]|jgi:N-acylglucosamine 2-epimerase|nr:N-acylglucosamine 2-epimerase [Clostridiales bacterium]